MSDPIETSGLRKCFGKHAAVDGLDLRVAAGSVYALIGSNGAGKSTTLKILTNILKDYEGDAAILGVESRRVGARELERVAYVSESQEMPDGMTVAELLSFWRPFYSRWDTAREKELLDLFRLPMDRKLKHLSRGMRMKAALASSLAYHPELIILDEPFTGLDPLVRDELVEALLDHASEATILISSHDLAEIESFASHVGFLEEGKLRFSEEMSGLSSRFREVEVTVDQTGLPPALPKHWLLPQSAPAVVRFVETQFDGDGLEAEVQSVFPNARRIETRPMPLRSIFIALAKAGKEAA
jgi:ABC-2 type transport system ATP-binding protein